MGLSIAAWISIAVAGLCALAIALDEARHPQKMRVMNVVWPVTALYFSVLGLWAYIALGRKTAHSRDGGPEEHRARHKTSNAGAAPRQPRPPTLSQTAIGTSHCGAGCMIADVVCDFAVAATGLRLFGSALATDYLIDFVGAWALGIVFQYFAIRPMRPELGFGGALAAAIKADTLSIVAFQIGMYAWMALVYFVLFPGPHLTAFDPRYWLMMQVGMIAGFLTSLPMNRWLIARGWKEAM